MMKRLKSLLLSALAAILLFPAAAFSENVSEQKGMILAHAGASLLAPENTMSSFRAAKTLGADGFETDVRMTKDGHLVIHHDDSIDQTSDGNGCISEMSLEELKTFDYGSWFGPEFKGEEILTLEECLEAAKELEFEIIDLELKPVTADIAADAADAILQSGYMDHVVVTSFDTDLLKEVKEYAPQIRVGIITVPDMSFLTMFNLSKHLPPDKPLEEFEAEDVKDIPGMVSIILKGFGAKGRTPEETLLEAIHGVAAATPPGTTYADLKEILKQEADIAGFVESLDFPTDYVCCHYETLTEELMEAMHEDGIGVMAWTVDKEEDLEIITALSPDGVITNQPETEKRYY